VPQRIKRKYRIADRDLEKKFLSALENSEGLEDEAHRRKFYR